MIARCAVLLFLLYFSPQVLMFGFGTISGPYYANMLSIKDMDVANDVAISQHHLVKINRYDSGIEGNISILQKVGPVGAHVHIEAWVVDRWLNVRLDAPDTPSVCDSSSFKVFLDSYSTARLLDEDCYMIPGVTSSLQPIVHLDTMMHKCTNSCIMGKYKVDLSLMAQEKPIIGYEFVINLEEEKYRQGGGKKKKKKKTIFD